VPATSGLGGMTPGRYLYPVVAAAMALFAVGLWARVRSTGWVVAMAALFVGLSLSNQVAYAFGKTAISHAERNGPPTYAVVSDVSASDTYRGVTVTADRVVTDRRAGGVWVHLHVRNESLLSADWSPNPQVKVSNGVSAYGDYPSSAPFPETLPGRSDYWGWIRLGLSPSRVPSGSTIVDRNTSRRGRSTTSNTHVSLDGGRSGGPNSIVHCPPTRRSHSDCTIQSGSSAYISHWARGSVNASKTTSGAAS